MYVDAVFHFQTVDAVFHFQTFDTRSDYNYHSRNKLKNEIIKLEKRASFDKQRYSPAPGLEPNT